VVGRGAPLAPGWRWVSNRHPQQSPEQRWVSNGHPVESGR